MSSSLFRPLRRAACLAVLSAASLVLGVPPVLPTIQPAMAIPTSCRVTTYYQTAEMVTVVGVRTNCPGSSNSGRTSPYKEVEVIDTSPEGPSPVGGGPGSLPCEFLAKGCGNLPARRFN